MARPVQKGLQQVRGVGQGGEAEGGRAALDRVRGAEDGVELLGIGRGDVELEQQLLHLGQQLDRFDEECLGELTEVHECSVSGFFGPG